MDDIRADELILEAYQAHLGVPAKNLEEARQHYAQCVLWCAAYAAEASRPERRTASTRPRMQLGW